MKIENNRQQFLQQVIPPLVGVALIVLFVRLGFWQLDRAAQKIEIQQAFDRPAQYVQVSADLQPESYQAIEARGQYLDDRQVIIENVVLDSALGYYVITPLEVTPGESLLLVNRGWVPRIAGKGPGISDLPDVTVSGSPIRVRGKSGNLPRVGIRPGSAFADRTSWPRMGVWPTIEEVAHELDREVLPYVLLLDADQAEGYKRHWTPKLAGPSTHYGYAFQWFAMATTLVILMAWLFRKKAREKSRDPGV